MAQRMLSLGQVNMYRIWSNSGMKHNAHRYPISKWVIHEAQTHHGGAGREGLVLGRLNVAGHCCSRWLIYKGWWLLQVQFIFRNEVFGTNNDQTIKFKIINTHISSPPPPPLRVAQSWALSSPAGLQQQLLRPLQHLQPPAAGSPSASSRAAIGIVAQENRTSL